MRVRNGSLYAMQIQYFALTYGGRLNPEKIGATEIDHLTTTTTHFPPTSAT